MKFGTLDLNKQTVARLTQDETSKIIGGGPAKSDRRRGVCTFSNKWRTQNPSEKTCGGCDDICISEAN